MWSDAARRAALLARRAHGGGGSLSLRHASNRNRAPSALPRGQARIAARHAARARNQALMQSDIEHFRSLSAAKQERILAATRSDIARAATRAHRDTMSRAGTYR